MLPDLSPHLHTEECNILIQMYRQCQKDHPIRKFLGNCNDWYDAIRQCIEIEHRLQRKRNKPLSNAKEKLLHIPKELYTTKLKRLDSEGKLRKD